jgi:predicted RNase H-like HicB family nuclease
MLWQKLNRLQWKLKNLVNTEVQSMMDTTPIFNAFQVELEQEDDGRWIADIPALAGVMVYGETQQQAIALVQALALRVIADKLEYGELI